MDNESALINEDEKEWKMSDVFTPEEQFLLKEYDTASKLTFHIDSQRNQVTSFILTFSGLVATGLLFLFKEAANTVAFAKPQVVLTIVLVLIGLIVVSSVVILARLRKTQIEHFRIISNIRAYFLKSNYDLWNVIQLSPNTLPTPNRKSGTYFWLVTIILLSSSIFGSVGLLVATEVFALVPRDCGYLVFLIVFAVAMFFQDWLYFYLAQPPAVNKYSKDNLPS